jgi:TatA/E family protein of Tat protein translocase
VIGDILQPSHLLFILVIALLVLGPKRLPDVGRALGRGMRDFRNALSGIDPRDELTGVGQISHPATMPVSTPQPTANQAETTTDVAPAPEPAPASAGQAPHESDEHSG